jgi:hypothetical protein
MKPFNQSSSVFWGVVLFLLFANYARANVFATDIRVNGSLDAGVITPGQPVTISYILNDNATGGVTVRVSLGNSVLETFSSDDDEAGTNAGLNNVTWYDTSGLTPGAYSVSITAVATGYDAWTNISDDGTDFSVFHPTGLAVNANTNSPYYGRVYVANSFASGDDQIGIFKYNADGSVADEGGFSTGGWGWSGQGFSPWKMEVGPDSRLYVDDFANDGVVISFTPTIRTNTYRSVVRTDNYPTSDPNPWLSGLAVTGTSDNAAVWMTDAYSSESSPPNPYGSAGIIRWQLTANGTAALNDPGTVVAPVATNALTEAPYDLALDKNGSIYAIQFLQADDGSDTLMQFSPFTGTLETNANWAVQPSMVNSYGVAVDPTATSVAVSVVGYNIEDNGGGGLYLYKASNGQLVSNIDETDGDSYTDVAWDHVGNLYALDITEQVWRIYSPPGANQATTPAISVVQVYNSILQPTLVNPVIDPCGLSFTLQGQSNVTYVIQDSADLINWTNMATNFSTSVNRTVHVPACGGQNFYRALTSP